MNILNFELQSTLESMLNLLSLWRKKSCCLAVWVIKEPEAADSLHRGPVDGDGDVSVSLSLPVVYNQLLSFADVEMEVVVLAPRCQVSDLPSLGRLVAVCDQAMTGHVVTKRIDGVVVD